ncbi:hypothetical protein BURK2_01935 [Burkholderiales bacterium]|nr:hypothetical protein BURK2_01935 [Burkholderiales bacterium]
MEAALQEQRTRNLERARELYGEVLVHAPETYDALHMLGVIEMELGDYARAEELIQASIGLMPTPEARINLSIVRQRRRSREGMYAVRSIQMVDAIGVFAARLPRSTEVDGVADARGAFFGNEGILHFVVPGDVFNAASNRLGVKLFQEHTTKGRSVKLWRTSVDPALPALAAPAATIDPSAGVFPDEGCVVIAGPNPAMLEWLPANADRLDVIGLLLDVREPQPLCTLLGQMPRTALAKLRFAARSQEVLSDLGLAGIADPDLLTEPRPGKHARRFSAKPRIGVFLMPLGGRNDLPRWDLLAWLRTQNVFIRLLYPRPLPSPHLANEDEHLVSLVTDWQDNWCTDLDALVYWGAEQRAHQFDTLLVEARAQGLPIVTDFGAETAGLGEDEEIFFSPQEAKACLTRLLEKLRG